MAAVGLCVVCISISAMAAEPNIDISTVDPAWMNQQLVLTVDGAAWALGVNTLADTTSLDIFLNGINTQLAAQVYEVPDTNGNVQKLYYQLNDDFRTWLISGLQARLAQNTDISTITVNLMENHLKIVNVNTGLNLTGYLQVGGCETSYEGSSKNRCNNVEIATARFNNLVVEPGMVVSVSNTILSRTRANGYLEAGAYENGETVPAVGGGICQVSSTIYNAVMNAGLTVIERHPHSMPVHYLPLGQDAVISEGAMDMQFRNDYNTPVVIQTKTADHKLTVLIYVNAESLQGRSYKFWSEKTSSLSATSYLTTYINGVEAQTVKVANSKYKPHN